jgi:Sec-independent protein translocase protein TatA
MWFIKLIAICIIFVVVFGDQHPKSLFKPLWDSFSETQKKAVNKIMENMSLTKAEVKSKVDSIVDKSGSAKTKVINQIFIT